MPLTRVLMADGSTKAISEVEVGDWVLAEDPETGERGARRVTDVIVGEGMKDLVDLEIDGETITATDAHPFWVADEAEWVGAEELQSGDELLVNDGSTTAIDGVRSYTERALVYNLTVEDIHTYFVVTRTDAVLVHNCVTPGQAGSYQELTRASRSRDGLEAHHMPQRAHGFTSPQAGGALVITETQHGATRTWRARGSQTLAAEAGMPFRDVLARDIADMRSIVGSEYNKGLLDLIAYYRTNFPSLMAKP